MGIETVFPSNSALFASGFFVKLSNDVFQSSIKRIGTSGTAKHEIVTKAQKCINVHNLATLFLGGSEICSFCVALSKYAPASLNNLRTPIFSATWSMEIEFRTA